MFNIRKNNHFYEKVGKKCEEVCIDDIIPFDIPDSWEWIRLSHISQLNGGFAFKSSEFKEEGVRVIRISDFDENGFKNDKIVYYEESSELEKYFLETNDILMAMTGGTVGKTYFVKNLNEKMYVNQRVATIRIQNLINKFYIYSILESDYIKNIIHKNKNSTNDNISMNTINSFLIPLPPLNEQNIIVKKLNEINPFIKNYENLESSLEHLNLKFPDKIKDSILQEAIQGKLVPQDLNDEPASVLLEKIRAEKERLVEEKIIKKNQKESIIYKQNNHYYEKIGDNESICIDNEIPFDIPNNWEWTRIKNIVTKLTDGAHKTPKYVDKGIPFLSVKDMSSGYLDFSDTKYISHEDFEKIYQRCNYEYGDILLTKVGTTGIPIIIDTNNDFGLFVSVALLKFNHDLINNEFLVYLINSPLVQLQCMENTKGVGNKNWVLRDIGNTLITIPPLKEQVRIVEKLNVLLQKLK